MEFRNIITRTSGANISINEPDLTSIQKTAFTAMDFKEQLNAAGETIEVRMSKSWWNAYSETAMIFPIQGGNPKNMPEPVR